MQPFNGCTGYEKVRELGGICISGRVHEGATGKIVLEAHDILTTTRVILYETRLLSYPNSNGSGTPPNGKPLALSSITSIM
jgi:hypothetical protein